MSVAELSKVVSTARIPAFNSVATETPDQIARRVGELVKIAISELVVPYELQNNLNAKKAQELSIKWINKNHVIADAVKIGKINASKFGDFMGKAHPRADLKTLRLVADFVTWLFIIDDKIEKSTSEEEVKKLRDRTITILSGGKCKADDDVLTHGLHKIVKRINTVWSLWKFIQDIRDYFEGTLWEMENRKSKKIPSLEDYQKMRPKTSGTLVMFDFIEVVEGLYIPQHVFESSYFKQIRLLGANLVNWENDLLSAPKEILNHDIHNLVFVYKDQYNCSYEEAFQHSVRDLTGDLAKFLELAEQVPDFGSYTDDVKKYISGIKEWLAAHHFWAKESPRYMSYFNDAAEEPAR